MTAPVDLSSFAGWVPSSRHWVADVIDAMLDEPHDGPAHPPEIFCRLIDVLMDPRDALNEGAARANALAHSTKSSPGKGSKRFTARTGTATCATSVATR